MVLPSRASSHKIKVTTTVSMVANLVKQVGGNRVASALMRLRSRLPTKADIISQPQALRADARNQHRPLGQDRKTLHGRCRPFPNRDGRSQYSYDRYNPNRLDVRVESLSSAPMNLKFGLCNDGDFQLGLESNNSVRTNA
jgi:hypothetical protein